MIVVAAVVLATIAVISVLLFGQEQAYAQNQTQGTNFTQLFSTDEEFLNCIAAQYGGGCIPYIDVLFQDPNLLVLSSDYIDIIWKGVARAQKEGYQIDSMTSYALTSGLPSSGRSNVNLLVAMSK